MRVIAASGYFGRGGLIERPSAHAMVRRKREHTVEPSSALRREQLLECSAARVAWPQEPMQCGCVHEDGRHARAGCELLLLFVVLRHQEWHRAWVLEQPAA